MRLNKLGEFTIDLFGLLPYVIRKVVTIHVASYHTYIAIPIWNGVARNFLRQSIRCQEKPYLSFLKRGIHEIVRFIVPVFNNGIKWGYVITIERK